MKFFKRLVASVAAFFMFNMVISMFFNEISAQSYIDKVKADPDFAAGIYHTYTHGDFTDTPAPKGYRPFYISHYGRHGSRYHTSAKYMLEGRDCLAAALASGNLTPAGESLYHDCVKVIEEHEGMEGQLSPLGAREHKAIAKRMYNRFRNAFSAKNRTEVECASSTVNRCLTSMANFSEGLNDCEPALDFNFLTGERYLNYIIKNTDNKGPYKASRHYEDSVRKAEYRYDLLFASIFKDPEEAKSQIEDPLGFVFSLYQVGAICADLDFLGVNVFKYFDAEELAIIAASRMERFHCQYGNSLDWGDVSNAMADDLLQDIIDRADKAVQKDSRRAADLRFGHDTGLVPLVCLIGLDGFDVRYPTQGVREHWTTTERVPMGSNLQIVFFANKAGKVLVKFLYNEQETIIPALRPTEGPYYEWPVLKQYLQDRVNRCRL